MACDEPLIDINEPKESDYMVYYLGIPVGKELSAEMRECWGCKLATMTSPPFAPCDYHRDRALDKLSL